MKATGNFVKNITLRCTGQRGRVFFENCSPKPSLPVSFGVRQDLEIMATLIEFVLPRRPLSHQAKDSKHKTAWKNYVYGRAFSVWKKMPIKSDTLKFTVVYLCEDDPADINNIIKPIQDALNSLVYSDDSLIWVT